MVNFRNGNRERMKVVGVNTPEILSHSESSVDINEEDVEII